MDRFEAMQVFCKVVEVGSFAGAADRLGMSTSAVSRLLAQLENLLDARLLNRTTRRISLTESGQAYYQRCLQLLADLAETEEMVSTNTANPRGTLRLTAPLSFGASHLAPALGEFARQHPTLKFDVMLSDRIVDLVEEGMDLAIRIGAIGNLNLVARRIGSARQLLCASPDYLTRRGTPGTPEELAGHDCLSYSYAADNNVWNFRDTAGNEHKTRVTGPVLANNGTVLAELAAAGLGVTFAPDFIATPLIDDGRLQILLPDWEPEPLPICAVYPSRRHLSAKVRSFVDFLGNWFSRNTWNTTA